MAAALLDDAGRAVFIDAAVLAGARARLGRWRDGGLRVLRRNVGRLRGRRGAEPPQQHEAASDDECKRTSTDATHAFIVAGFG